MSPLPLIHLDDDLIAVDKPAGLLSVPGRGPDKQDCVLSRLLQRHPDALVVHRLDQATSGLLLFARHLPAQQALSRAFEKRQVHKRYLAIVAGRPEAEQGRIELPLAADWPRRPLQKVDLERGKPSITDWQWLSYCPEQNSSRLALMPQTGRSHQLRVHLQAIGHPILGDALYATSPWRHLSARLLLHAEHLALPHPGTGLPLQLSAPCPF